MYQNIPPYKLPPRGKRVNGYVPVVKFGLDGKYIAWYPSVQAAAVALNRLGQATLAGISWACRVKREAFGFQWRHASECRRKNG